MTAPNLIYSIARNNKQADVVDNSNEYQNLYDVIVYVNGKYDIDKCYTTDCKQDAKAYAKEQTQ